MEFRCNGCRYRTAKWMGFCPQCGADGLESIETGGSTGDPADAVWLAEILAGDPPPRLATGSVEVDRVLGGGFVPGSSTLLGGEPGVGKSTILLQVASKLGEEGKVLVASAEESAEQLGLRAARVGARSQGLMISIGTDVDAIVSAMRDLRPGIVIVDSVQAVSTGAIDGAVGGVAQVRESASRLVAAGKALSIPVVLIGHVTKDGSLAGPKVLEHMVDVVLQLDGDEDGGVRFLRSIKNRYGAVDQVGVFEMTEKGLRDVPDPSAFFTRGRGDTAPGTVIFPTVQGRRSFLVEVQALVAFSPSGGTPRRSVKGLDVARVHQLLAVLDRHCGLRLGGVEVYVNVVGGVRLAEPAADLPVALALVSALLETPLDGVAAWGEVGLTGELRAVGSTEARRKETARMQHLRAVAPSDGLTSLNQAIVSVGIRTAFTPRLSLV